MKRHLTALLLPFLLAGCAHNYVDTYEPVIDTQGVDINRYAADLNECRSYAVREDPTVKAQQGAIAGALAGALLGAALGSVYGQAGRGAGIGAAEGGAVGLIGGAAGGIEAQQIIVNRCMAGRQYRVLF